MNRRIKMLLSIALIAIAATTAIGLLKIDIWNIVTRAAFSFIIWSELVFFGGLIALETVSAKTEQVYARSGTISLLSLYLITVCCVSLVFIIHFPLAIISFWVIQIVIIAVVAILAILIFMVSKRVYSSNNRTMTAVSKLGDYVCRLKSITKSENAKDYTPVISKLAEDLRFTDTSIIVDVDAQIEESISSLELMFVKDDINSDDVDRECARINSLIKKRKVLTLSARRGEL